MSWNRMIFLLCTLCISLFAEANILTVKSTPLPDTNNEDSLIIKAILTEGEGNYSKSRETYEKLFALTGNKEYLIREAQDALAQKKDIERSISNLMHWVTQHPADHDRKLYLVLAALYIQNDALQDADEIVDAYLTKGDVDAKDLQEFGALKVQLGEYEDALKLFQRAYKLSPDEDTAMQISALYLLKFKKPQKAIEVLQHYVDQNPSASIGLYFKLIELYAKEYKLDKVLELYKQLYKKEPQKYFLQKIIEISLYLKDTDGLIKFLEETQGNEELLYSAYKSNGLYDKALALTKKMYIKTGKPRWLSEQAILMYEQAQRKHNITPKLLREVSLLFENAFAHGGRDPIYLNYYGYTLIDHDMDIDKGIGLVRRALGKDPNNIFYLDSLAWGLYKKGQCQKAYKLMLQIVRAAGLKEQEIKDHYKAIGACVSKNKHRRKQ